MKIKYWLLIAILIISSGCGGDDDDGGDGPKQVGAITRVPAQTVYIDDVDHPGPGDTLAAGNVIRTDSRGRVSFSLDDQIEDCALDYNAALQIFPTTGILIEFQNGVTSCQTEGEHDNQEYTAGEHLTIRNDGTFFRVTVDGETVRIKVFEGLLTVESSQTNESVQIGDASEITAIDGDLPSEATPSPVTLAEFNDFERDVFDVRPQDPFTPTPDEATEIPSTATSMAPTNTSVPTNTPVPTTRPTDTREPDPTMTPVPTPFAAPVISKWTDIQCEGYGIQWEYADPAASFHVFRSFNDDAFEEIDTLGAGETTFCSAEMFTNRGDYCYYVTAFNNIQLESEPSNEVCFDINPEPVQNLRLKASSGSITLTWDYRNDIDGFTIFRYRTDETSPILYELDTVGGDVRNYVDREVDEDAAVCYWVRAFDESGSTGDQPRACNEPPPATPTPQPVE
jgi:hypothetical protein